jgi:pyruvate-formate lyase-activating enzyme
MTLIYGAVSCLSANPIEKKPFYHFHPGTRALTSGSWSCNFGCPWCQNYHISKTAPGRGRSLSVSPEGFVARATSLSCEGTSISLNEPTLSLEWSLDVFRLARARGLYNTYAYYPAYRFTAPPAATRTLERAWHVGREAGLHFVYMGNVLGHRLENTYCPDCGTLLIERWGLSVARYQLEQGRCPQCDRKVAGVWTDTYNLSSKFA